MPPESVVDALRLEPPEAIEAFMRVWHGIEPAAYEVDGRHRLPATLRGFLETYGAARDAFSINHLLRPDEYGIDGRFCVFYAEEQGVYLWGVALDDMSLADPPVWCRENEPGEAWIEESPRLSTFLVQMLVMSAALQGPTAAHTAWLSSEETDEALASMTQLDLPPWHWPGHPARWYASDDAVAFTCPNSRDATERDAQLSVWVSARSTEGLVFLEPYVDDAWDYYSPSDDRAHR